MRVPVRLFIFNAALFLSALPTNAQLPSEFYKDKQIKFLVSSSVGGGFDTYTRLIARHIQKHMPGNPAFVVQNMAGAGGLHAANFIYSIAPKDGTTIALFQNTLPLEPLYGNKQALLDANKLQWLGSPSQEFAVFAIALPVSFFVAASVGWWLALIGSLMALIIVELLNTAIEKLSDHVTSEHSHAIKVVKDLGSAAVFVALLLAFGIWVAALWTRFF